MTSGWNKFGWSLLAITTVVVVPAYGADSGGVTLRYKFKQGETLPYVMSQKMDMTMNVAGQEIDMKTNMVMNIDWHVQKVEDNGSAKMAQTVTRIRFTMEGGPIGKVEYDSKSNQEPEGPVGKAVAPMFKAMVGSAFTFTMSPQGKLTDFTVPEKFTEAVKNAPGGGGNMFSPDQFKQMVQQSVPLPSEPVTKGKSWNQKLDIKLGPLGTMEGKNVMTYEGTVEKNGHKLQEIALKPDFKLKPGGNSPVKFDLKKQDAKGKILFDNQAGRIVDSTLDQTMDLTGSVMGQELTQKIKQTVTMKLAGSAKK